MTAKLASAGLILTVALASGCDSISGVIEARSACPGFDRVEFNKVMADAERRRDDPDAPWSRGKYMAEAITSFCGEITDTLVPECEACIDRISDAVYGDEEEESDAFDGDRFPDVIYGDSPPVAGDGSAVRTKRTSTGRSFPSGKGASG